MLRLSCISTKVLRGESARASSRFRPKTAAAAAASIFKSASFIRWLQYPHFWTDFDHSHGKLGVLEVVRFVELHHLSIQRLISGLWTHFRIPITSSSKVCSKCCLSLVWPEAVVSAQPLDVFSSANFCSFQTCAGTLAMVCCLSLVWPEVVVLAQPLDVPSSANCCSFQTCASTLDFYSTDGGKIQSSRRRPESRTLDTRWRHSAAGKFKFRRRSLPEAFPVG